MFHKITPARELSTDDSILTLTNGSGSPGDTSASSLTWAEDAVRQNKEEWDRIDRILYCEEPLPTKDKALREELVQWMHAFPHLRLIGTPAQMHYSSNLKATDPDYEEVFAAHPQSQSAQTRQEFLESELEECLTINSGIASSPVPSLHHRTAVIYKPIDNQPRPNLPRNLPSILSKNCLIEKIKTLELDRAGRVTRGHVAFRTYEPLITYSAKAFISTKLPQPTTNIFFRKDLQSTQNTPINSKSATPRIKASVTLPAINVTTPPSDSGIAARSLDSGIIGRSISATNIPNRKHVKWKHTLPDLAIDND